MGLPADPPTWRHAWRAAARWLLLPLLPLLFGMLLAGCDMPPEDSPADAVRQRLVGTWLREYTENGTHVRRVLILEAQGHFREYSSVLPPDGQARHDADGEGEWLFDGTNLKRHYRRVNGRKLAAPAVPFVTFELSFPSRFAFVGVDHVHRLRVEYERVPDGTLP